MEESSERFCVALEQWVQVLPVSLMRNKLHHFSSGCRHKQAKRKHPCQSSRKTLMAYICLFSQTNVCFVSQTNVFWNQMKSQGINMGTMDDYSCLNILVFSLEKIFNFFYILNMRMVTIAILKYFKNYWHLQFHHNKTVSFSTVALGKPFLSIWQFKHVTPVCGPESEFLQKHNLEYKHQTHQIISLKKSFIFYACLSAHLSNNLSTYISQALLLETF